MTELRGAPVHVGLKQSRKDVEEGTAKKVYIADDADPHVTDAFAELCKKKSVEVVRVKSMSELGKASGIDVGAAVVTVLK